MSSPLTLPQVYLARHGQTAWSLSGQHTGRTDLPLTPAGEKAATRLGDRLRAVGFDRVLASPLARARRTAELAGFANPAIDPDLTEWDYGEAEGLTTAEYLKRRPGWELFRDGGPGGESVADISARADRLVARLRQIAGTTLLFSSGHLLRVLAARWVGAAAVLGRPLVLDTGGVCVLGYDRAPDCPAIRLWNDTAHLSEDRA